MSERRGIRDRKRATLTLTLRNIKEGSIDWFSCRLVTIGRDLHIYRLVDIALHMNRRILTKYGENLDSDSGLICENRTVRFFKPEPSDLQPGAFLKWHNFLVRALNHVWHISILIVSTMASLWSLQILSLSSSSYSLKNFFISWVKLSQIVRETRAYPGKHKCIVQLVKYIKLTFI
jgi:hypothetical protein